MPVIPIFIFLLCEVLLRLRYGDARMPVQSFFYSYCRNSGNTRCFIDPAASKVTAYHPSHLFIHTPPAGSGLPKDGSLLPRA